jgi:glycosyltransferase involved in cell wall biosynthesis
MKETVSMDASRIAILIPCLDEEATIGKVVDDFRARLPQAEIHVFDNASVDRTREVAEAHGAIVTLEPRRGKGYVVARMFESVEADYYILVDGDDTYPADKVHDLLEPVLRGRADMVVGSRLAVHALCAFRPLHVFGNNLVQWLMNRIFSASLTDVLSGYRAFNSKVAEQLPLVSAGFEVETEMTAQLLYHRMVIEEVVVPYRGRPSGSVSKLRTFQDGTRVLWTLFSLIRACKPLTFFGGVGLLLLILGIACGIPPVLDYVERRYVEHVPLAILAVGLVNVGFASVILGILLHAINWRMREMHNVFFRRRR